MIKSEEVQEMSAQLPKNIRQIGEVDQGHRIYMEDYAYTYLHQYANKKEEQIAFLVGQQTICEGEKVILIQGAIQGKYLQRDTNNVEITNETLEHVHDMLNHYFNEHEIIGWVYTQPGYGVILTSFLVKQHQSYFSEGGQVLFVLDPTEKEEVFFEYIDGEMIQRNGFFIYYEKNSAMHEYMLDHKISGEVYVDHKLDDHVVVNYRFKEQERREELYHRKFVNMLFALSGALVIMCIIIGIGLINNLEEMNALKQSFSAVMEDYSALKGDLEVGNLTDNQAQPAMATSDNQGISDEELSGNEDSQQNSEQDNNLNTDSSELSSQDSDSPEQNNAENNSGDTTDISNNASVETDSTAESSIIIPESYIVKQGDTLIRISVKFYSTSDMVSEIQELNNIKNPQKIYIGQKLILPQPH